MRVMVIGANGGSGRAIVEALLAQGFQVTAFARSRGVERPGLRWVQGDVTAPGAVAAVMSGHDAVVVALGIRENPLLVRLRGSVGTPLDVRSRGTREVVAAMKAHGVTRLVVQTTYGVGESDGKLPLKWRLLFSLLLAPQIEDTRRQEKVVKESGLEWVLVQPVALDDGPAAGLCASTQAQTTRMVVSRKSVGRFMASAVKDVHLVHKTVALSAES